MKVTQWCDLTLHLWLCVTCVLPLCVINNSIIIITIRVVWRGNIFWILIQLVFVSRCDTFNRVKHFTAFSSFRSLYRHHCHWIRRIGLPCKDLCYWYMLYVLFSLFSFFANTSCQRLLLRLCYRWPARSRTSYGRSMMGICPSGCLALLNLLCWNCMFLFALLK